MLEMGDTTVIAPRRHVAEMAMYVLLAAAWLPRAIIATFQPIRGIAELYFASSLRGDGSQYTTEVFPISLAMFYPVYPALLLPVAAVFALYFVIRGPRAVRLLAVAQIVAPPVLFVLSELAWRIGRMNGMCGSFVANWLLVAMPVTIAVVRNRATERTLRE